MVLKKCFPIVFLVVSCTRVVVNISPVPEVLRDEDCYYSALAVDNNQLIEEQFELKERTNLKIISQGEGTSYSMVPGFIDSFLNDCIEYFIDLGDVCRQYRFVWGSELCVQGNNADMTGVVFAQGDPSPTEYVFEVKFPWQTLGLKEEAKLLRTLRMDVSIIDNDAESRKSQIAWNGKNADLYKDWSQFGTFDLKDSRTSIAPEIDGEVDDIWNTQKRYLIEHEIVGTVNGKSDLSGDFSILFDNQNLYLLVEVFDDIKKQAAFMFDKACIIDEAGTTVWQMMFERTVHAGGALKNRRQEDTVLFEPGKYTVRYMTDECHSFGHWDDVPPNDQFSGIKLYLTN